MKVIPGTNKRKKEKEDESREFTKETSGEPKETKKSSFKVPKAVTDDPAKHRYQRTVRPIANGHITEHSYTNPDNGEYIRHEFFTAEDPFAES